MISGNSGSTSTAAALVLRASAGVFRIGDEGDFGGAGVLNPFYASNFQFRVAAQFRAQPTCKLAKFHRGDCNGVGPKGTD